MKQKETWMHNVTDFLNIEVSKIREILLVELLENSIEPNLKLVVNAF